MRPLLAPTPPRVLRPPTPAWLALRAPALALLLGLGAGCPSSTPVDDDDDSVGDDDDSVDDDDDDTVGCSDTALPLVQPWDEERATAGAALLADGSLSRPLVPNLALENLWAVWGSGPPSSPEQYRADFARRYGLAPRPEAGDWPYGVVELDGGVGFDCLLCHADQVAGQTIVGAGNSRIDLELLFDDLVALAALAETLGLPAVELPYDLDGLNGAPGAVDAFGLGMELSLLYGPPGADIETEYGFQQSNGWWALARKGRSFWDGAGDAAGHRTMAAMLLAFGLSWPELQSLDDELTDLAHYIRSIPTPVWPEPIDEPLAAQGEALFGSICSQCHGTYCGEEGGEYPDRLVDLAGIQTDPARADGFGEDEALWVNASWFGGDHPMQATTGYQAPVLSGVWAAAPYFHNGSVPDVMSVLDSTRRPARWRRTGSEAEHYDAERLGWRYEELGPEEPAGRDVYDTTLPGLGNAGHTFADHLDDGQRRALVEYLKTL